MASWIRHKQYRRSNNVRVVDSNMSESLAKKRMRATEERERIHNANMDELLDNKSGYECTEDFLQDTLSLDVIVIGNGIPKYKYGKFIDISGSVIRFNNFIIDGFEDVVGTKITHWCTNATSVIEYQPLCKDIQSFVPFTSTRFPREHIALYVEKTKQVPLFTKLDYTPLNPKDVTYPSTGYYLLKLLCHLGFKPYIIGFDFFQSTHYFNDGHHHCSAHVGSNAIAEKKDIMNNYVERGLIKIL